MNGYQLVGGPLDGSYVGVNDATAEVLAGVGLERVKLGSLEFDAYKFDQRGPKGQAIYAPGKNPRNLHYRRWRPK